MDWDLALLLWGSSVSSDSTSPTLTILLRRRDILLLPEGVEFHVPQLVSADTAERAAQLLFLLGLKVLAPY